MSLWLTPSELVELTGFRQREKQKKALGSMGVPFRSREKDGFPMVDRAVFENSAHTVLQKPEKRREPRLEFVRQ